LILFVYGTLLDARVLDRMAGVRGLHRRLRPARLAGFTRVYLRGTPYPTLVRRAGATVDGALLRVTGAPLARLNAYEGPSYALHPLRVETRRGPVRAVAWMAQRWRADQRGWMARAARLPSAQAPLTMPAMP